VIITKLRSETFRPNTSLSAFIEHHIALFCANYTITMMLLINHLLTYLPTYLLTYLLTYLKAIGLDLEFALENLPCYLPVTIDVISMGPGRLVGFGHPLLEWRRTPHFISIHRACSPTFQAKVTALRVTTRSDLIVVFRRYILYLVPSSYFVPGRRAKY